MKKDTCAFRSRRLQDRHEGLMALLLVLTNCVNARCLHDIDTAHCCTLHLMTKLYGCNSFHLFWIGPSVQTPEMYGCRSSNSLTTSQSCSASRWLSAARAHSAR